MNRKSNSHLGEVTQSDRWDRNGLKRWSAVLQKACFWLAVILPMAYIGIFVPEIAFEGPPHLLAVLGIHVVTIVIGHGYETDGGNEGGAG